MQYLAGRRRETAESVTMASSAGAEGDELDYVAIAGDTEGYSVADLKDLVDLALQEAMIRSTQDDGKVRARACFERSV